MMRNSGFRSLSGTHPRWKEERTDLLRRLWLDGKSAASIAAVIGDVTRNAVLGKVHRMKLSIPRHLRNNESIKAHRAPREGLGQKNMPAIRSHIMAALRPVEPVAFAIDANVVGIPLTALDSSTCRWPLWGSWRPAEYTYCGATPSGGSVYCEAHSRRARVGA